MFLCFCKYLNTFLHSAKQIFMNLLYNCFFVLVEFVYLLKYLLYPWMVVNICEFYEIRINHE